MQAPGASLYASDLAFSLFLASLMSSAGALTAAAVSLPCTDMGDGVTDSSSLWGALHRHRWQCHCQQLLIPAI